jgi:phosphocarrier protein HPr
MPERKVTVGSARGLHARPAKIFVEAAARQAVQVSISAPGRPPVPAASLLAVLTLGAAHGTEVTLHADGDQADQALDELAALLTADLDAEEAGHA